jgi:benzoyl-CoA-dihydrodiol lyase
MADAPRKLANGATRIDFQTDPSRYRHWKLEAEGEVATLTVDVDGDCGLHEGYPAHDELHALGTTSRSRTRMQRLRSEHPAVKVVILRSAQEPRLLRRRDIRMLAGSPHGSQGPILQVPQRDRNGDGDSSEHSGQKFICVVTAPRRAVATSSLSRRPDYPCG